MPNITAHANPLHEAKDSITSSRESGLVSHDLTSDAHHPELVQIEFTKQGPLGMFLRVNSRGVAEVDKVNGAAVEVGLLKGDVIVKVGEHDTRGMDVNGVKPILASAGRPLTIQIERSKGGSQTENGSSEKKQPDKQVPSRNSPPRTRPSVMELDAIGQKIATSSELAATIRTELGLFRQQFMTRRERSCAFLWSADADFKQCSPTSTEVWEHWQRLVTGFVLVVSRKKVKMHHRNSCCTESIRDIYHFDHKTDLEWEAQFADCERSDGRPLNDRSENDDLEVTMTTTAKYEKLDMSVGGILRSTKVTSKKSVQGLVDEESTTNIRELIMTPKDCLMRYIVRYVAYCLCLADLHWRMIDARSAVEMCIIALHALVARQNNCFDEIDAPEHDVSDLLEFVWAKLRDYNQDSRMSSKGKDAFLQDLTRKFAKGDFVKESRAWFNTLEGEQSSSISNQTNGTGGTDKGEDALSQSFSGQLALSWQAEAYKAAVGWENEAFRVKDQLDKEMEMVSKGEDETPEGRLVVFSRHLKNTREQENRYQGFGYALSVYLMYAVVAFGLVYIYETSHCEVVTDPYYWTSIDSREQFNWTSYQYDIVAIKNGKTASIFGGVYGPRSNAGMYVFEGADSEAWYMKNYKIPVPRPSCAKSCTTAQFVCYEPTCVGYTEDYEPISIGIDNAPAGAVCRCRTKRPTATAGVNDTVPVDTITANPGNAGARRGNTTTPTWDPDLGVNSGAPVWDTCGVRGTALWFIRTFWSAIYFGVAILEIILFTVAMLFVDWPAPPRTSFESAEFMQRRMDDIRR
jgi:hypothetical protein